MTIRRYRYIRHVDFGLIHDAALGWACTAVDVPKRQLHKGAIAAVHVVARSGRA